jgi:transketolase N-terminal domain/subunit
MIYMISLQAPQVVELNIGDTLRLAITFGYRGHGQQVTLYAAIGNLGIFGFDEIIAVQKPVDLPESPDSFTTCEESMDISMTNAISPGTGYSLMAKIKEYQSQTEVRVSDVVNIIGAPSMWSGITSVMLVSMMMAMMGQVMPTEQG